MLTKLIIVLSKEYRQKIQDTYFYQELQTEMKNKKIEILLLEAELWIEKKTVWLQEEADVLWMSDDSMVLMELQAAGCFTIAVYHDGVRGLLSGTQYAVEGLEDIDWDYLNKIYQRYHNIPWEITQTKRCVIREMGEDDLEDLYTLYENPEVTRYTENLFSDRDKEKKYIHDYIENIYKYYGFGTWLICDKEDGRLIGRAGFNYRPGYREVELGFVIGYPDWRKGYAFEVCGHLLQIGKEVFEFGKIQALVDESNQSSVGLLRKLGFVYQEDVILDGSAFQRYLYE